LGPCIMQIGPLYFIPGTDVGLMLRDCQLAADISIHLCVCQMMYHLSNRPATGTVRRIELAFRKVRNGGPQHIGSARKLGEQCAPGLSVGRRSGLERSNRISQILPTGC
jgi:hypothetical protein